MAAGNFTINQILFNCSQDSDFAYKLIEADFVPLNSNQTIVQVLGVGSGDRVIQGYFFKAADYATIEGYFRLGYPVDVTDWNSYSFIARIVDLVPAYVNDVNTAFQTRTYKMTLRKVGL